MSEAIRQSSLQVTANRRPRRESILPFQFRTEENYVDLPNSQYRNGGALFNSGHIADSAIPINALVGNDDVSSEAENVDENRASSADTVNSQNTDEIIAAPNTDSDDLQDLVDNMQDENMNDQRNEIPNTASSRAVIWGKMKNL